MATPATPTDLRAVLDAIGDTAPAATALLAGLDEDALRASAPGSPSCLDIVQEMLEAGADLGSVAHDVLGHVPGAGAAYAEQATRADGAQLLRQLHYLREHIVSTVDQQGAAVWSTPTPAGRPLFAYAVDLQQRDLALLAALRRAAAFARQR